MKKIGKYLFAWGLIILIIVGISVVLYNIYNNYRYNKDFEELRLDAIQYLEETYHGEMYVAEKVVKGWFNNFSEPYFLYAHPIDDENLWFKVNFSDGEFTDNYFRKYLQVGAGDIIDEVVDKYSDENRCFAEGKIKDEFGFQEYYNENGKLLGYEDIEYEYIYESQITIYDYEDSRNAEPFISEILENIVDLGICKDGSTMIRFYIVNPKNVKEYTAYFYYYYDDGGFGGPTSKFTN